MKILYATSEAVPFCKTGGLADVAGSLPSAMAKQGAEVAVVLPLYRLVKERFGAELKFECFDYVDLAWRHTYCGLFSLEKDGVTWYFIDNEQYFDRPELYGYMDDGERFGFFSRAVVRMLPHMQFWPEVIHCNDWQTALVPIYLKDEGVREERLRSIRTALTIHNIEYQGRYGKETLGDLFGLDYGWAADGTLLMDGDVNLLKGAILCADAVNAVSPTYANELKMAYFAHRMETIMRRCTYKLSGVLNGIDTKLYDPETDRRLSARFSAEHPEGKDADKAELQKLMGLRQEAHTPIVAIVSRLVSHKGLDLICEVLHDMMELPMQLVILGKGDQKYEEFFRWAAQQYEGRMAVRLDYNEELSMSIYAGADLFLMPSKSEPCGLSQMIAMRYGTVPIVRETGGLKDTVQPYESWRDAGNGFSFRNYASGDMLYVIREAVYLYKDYPDAFARLRKRAMECDFSWERSAKEYLRIYAGITAQAWPVVPEIGPVGAAEEAKSTAEGNAVIAAETAVETPAAEVPTETPAAEVPAATVPVEEKETPLEEAAPAEPEKPEKKEKKPAARKGAAKKTPVKKAVGKKTETTPDEKTANVKHKYTPKKGPAAKPKKKETAE
ncbi:glycogen synthase GlgA [Oscillibacter sp.]|uniref:glycogen synthase GlgA n=1 Tax=Oscillibacter sp. TaxID=1945593 RepID=UPI002608A702|nr:glycogen synthase GlgA [Oscillibacter sp.]MDD3347710.1 glycogen synthase GlgA [Oscillibacter sp.]